MRPPVLRRFLAEDYQDAPAWFGRFIGVLNQFMQEVVTIFSKNVSFGDNIQARSFNTSFTTPALYATGSFDTIKFSWTGTSLPVAVLIVGIYRDDGSIITSSVGIPTWRYGEGLINISYISGLTASTKYNISLLAF